MILIEFIKNAFLYPPILKEWANWLFYMYHMIFIYVIFWIVIYIIIRYISLRLSKKKSEIIASVDSIWTVINYWFFKSFWLILINKCKFLKQMIISIVIVDLAWIFISFFFFLSWSYTEFQSENINIINDYSVYISSHSWFIEKWILLPTQFLQQNNNYLNLVLWLTGIYVFICFVIWWFFMTFSFGNKFVRNIGILFWILSFLIIILWKLLDFYSIK